MYGKVRPLAGGKMMGRAYSREGEHRLGDEGLRFPPRCSEGVESYRLGQVSKERSPAVATARLCRATAEEGQQFFLARLDLVAHGHEIQLAGGAGLGEDLVALFLPVVVDGFAQDLDLGVERLVGLLRRLDLGYQVLGACAPPSGPSSVSGSPASSAAPFSRSRSWLRKRSSRSSFSSRS